MCAEDKRIEYYSDFIHVACDCALILDQSGKVIFCEFFAEGKIPFEKDEIINRPFEECVEYDKRERIKALLSLCDNTNVPRRILYADDKNHFIAIDARARWKKGSRDGYSVLLTNLSDRTGWGLGEHYASWEQPFSAKDGLVRHVKQQELVAEISTQYAISENRVASFKSALQRLGHYLEASHVSVYRDDHEHHRFSCVYTWESEEEDAGARVIDIAYAPEDEDYLELTTQPFVFRHRELEAVIKVPLMTGGHFWGYLEVRGKQKDREWLFRDIHVLQPIAGIISGALERKAIEDEREETFLQLNSLVDNYPGLVWFVDQEDTITFCEGLLLDDLGLRSSDIIGRKEWEALAAYGIDDREGELSRIEEGGVTILKTPNRFLTCTISVLRDQNGENRGRIVIAQDVTELRIAQQDLEKAVEAAEGANRVKSEFLSRMSHEIRTPMNAIIGMNAIAQKAKEIEKVRYCLDKIESSSKHLMSLINDVMDMSKIEAGQFELHETEFDFEKMLQYVCGAVEEKIREKEQTLTVDFNDVFLRNLRCDELRLSQLLNNLLGNAVKFTPSGGKISMVIRHWPLDEKVSLLHVEVEDNGIGIPQEKQKLLFELFEQVESGSTRRFGGSGLGLAICKRIVELMGGTIWVESELGKGSRFVFEVLFQWGDPLHPVAPKEDLDRDKVRILAVDADKDARIYFQTVLEHFELRNDTASSGPEAMGMVRAAVEARDPYQIVFLADSMPAVDGRAVREMIQSISGESTVVLVNDPASGAETATDGAEDFLISKPLLPPQVYNTIVEIMENPLVIPAGPNTTTFQWNGKKLLLAEDVEINREIVLNILAETGISVDCAVDGQEAVKMYYASPLKYDLVLMDIQMPEMDGMRATRIIRESGLPNSQTIPIIAMTANVFQEDIEQCLASGMNGHIPKPIHVDEFMDTVQSALSQSVH